MSSKPPAAVIPDTALVTDIRGECKAGVTPHTTLYPMTPAREKVVTIWLKARFGDAIPRPINETNPAIKKITSLQFNSVHKLLKSLNTNQISY